MLQRFLKVIHITSTVSGDIQDGKGASRCYRCYIDSWHIVWSSQIVLSRFFMNPKSPRGVYGGGVAGYIDFR